MVGTGLTYIVELLGKEQEFSDPEQAFSLFRKMMHHGASLPDRELSRYYDHLLLWIDEMPGFGLYAKKIPCLGQGPNGEVIVDDGNLRAAFDEWVESIDPNGRAQADRERERYPELTTRFLQERYPPSGGRKTDRSLTGAMSKRLTRSVDAMLGRR
jgi:hypothetical protein